MIRFLLRLYPRDFRQRYERELLEFHRQRAADGVRLALMGIAIGFAGAAALMQTIRSMLVGVPSVDVLTMLGVAALLGAVAVLASLLPARRATAVSPTEALRGG